jgi:hypothetical protein
MFFHEQSDAVERHTKKSFEKLYNLSIGEVELAVL